MTQKNEIQDKGAYSKGSHRCGPFLVFVHTGGSSLFECS